MKSYVAIYWLIFIATLATAYGSLKAYRRLHPEYSNRSAPVATASAERTGPPMRDFVLTERSGEKFDSKDLSGHVWIGSYFFSSCPGTCYKMNRVLAEVQKEFADQDLTLVSITCDPDIDTPEVLTAYAASFNADPKKWLFLAGPFGVVSRIGSDLFLITVEHKAHSDRIVVFDKRGQVRGRFRATDPLEMGQAKALVKRLLAENVDDLPAQTELPLEIMNETEVHSLDAP